MHVIALAETLLVQVQGGRKELGWQWGASKPWWFAQDVRAGDVQDSFQFLSVSKGVKAPAFSQYQPFLTRVNVKNRQEFAFYERRQVRSEKNTYASCDLVLERKKCIAFGHESTRFIGSHGPAGRQTLFWFQFNPFHCLLPRLYITLHQSQLAIHSNTIHSSRCRSSYRRWHRHLIHRHR